MRTIKGQQAAPMHVMCLRLLRASLEVSMLMGTCVLTIVRMIISDPDRGLVLLRLY